MRAERDAGRFLSASRRREALDDRGCSNIFRKRERFRPPKLDFLSIPRSRWSFDRMLRPSELEKSGFVYRIMHCETSTFVVSLFNLSHRSRVSLFFQKKKTHLSLSLSLPHPPPLHSPQLPSPSSPSSAPSAPPPRTASSPSPRSTPSSASPRAPGAGAGTASSSSARPSTSWTSRSWGSARCGASSAPSPRPREGTWPST